MPTHAERRRLPYQPEQLYDLVADVERYPEFLPWCLGARIKRREGNTLIADLIVGFKMIRERFTSRVVLHDDETAKHLRIDVTYVQGPFKYLNNHWLFIPDEQGCMLDFYVDFEFRSRLLQKVMQPLFNEAVRRMVGAFETRARELYGDPRKVIPASP
ncbi:MAG TPA: type II toxin-antitoxin system RatA family toxin [Kiloniellales bacterium]|jgi:coenzyme Q-binding protein COQ10|nr:type II toxin-antitoxin system RatA family toxin [Kiloniellales bacterium]